MTEALGAHCFDELGTALVEDLDLSEMLFFDNRGTGLGRLLETWHVLQYLGPLKLDGLGVNLADLL